MKRYTKTDGYVMREDDSGLFCMHEEAAAIIAEHDKEVAAKHETRVSELSREILELRSILRMG